ncbi:MAG: type II and III secretion system protein, partial [Planctomycetes bacterium]|nr:type II and III secretion system protein [Planctomycetota bacterium]
LAGVDFRSIASTSVGGTNLVPGTFPPSQFDNGTGAVATELTGAISDGGVTFGLITNNVAMFVRALEEIVDLTIIANPKVLAVNEQPGRVIVGREDGYLTTTVTETAAIQTVEFIETGTQILFRPFIANDGTIRMDIHPEDSSGGLTPDNLPFKDTTEVTSNVLIEDGHTLVIGGLFREVTTSRNTQIPWLGNLPLVGPLFRGKIDSAVREEVIVLITPHIIDGGADDGESAWALEEVERRRVLSHRGLMPWGRERLAQAHYGWALEHHRAGRVDKALWDLDLALSLNPRFMEADRLREELTKVATQEPDNSVIHHLVRQMIEQELSRDEDDERSTTGEASEVSHEDE